MYRMRMIGNMHRGSARGWAVDDKRGWYSHVSGFKCDPGVVQYMLRTTGGEKTKFTSTPFFLSFSRKGEFSTCFFDSPVT